SRARAPRHGWRVRARARVAVGLAGVGGDRPLLRRGAHALDRDGAPGVPAAARALARRDARRDLRRRLPDAVDRAPLVRLIRQDRNVTRVPEPAVDALRG